MYYIRGFSHYKKVLPAISSKLVPAPLNLRGSTTYYNFQVQANYTTPELLLRPLCHIRVGILCNHRDKN